jgi:hypothetical protein
MLGLACARGSRPRLYRRGKERLVWRAHRGKAVAAPCAAALLFCGRAQMGLARACGWANDNGGEMGRAFGLGPTR